MENKIMFALAHSRVRNMPLVLTLTKRRKTSGSHVGPMVMTCILDLKQPILYSCAETLNVCAGHCVLSQGGGAKSDSKTYSWVMTTKLNTANSSYVLCLRWGVPRGICMMCLCMAQMRKSPL